MFGARGRNIDRGFCRGVGCWSIRVCREVLGCLAGSGEEIERVDMCGSHDPEVSFVECRDDSLVQAFGCGHGGSVDDVEAGIGVDGDEFVDSVPVSSGEIDDTDVAGQDRANELLLCVWAVAVQQQPAGFGDHWCG